jgi:hypothetical protein
MTPYNTGKVLIGSAYTPRIKPERASPVSGPNRPRSDGTRLWACVLAVSILAALALATWP